MYKVVLCAFFAIAAAKPDLLLTAPGYTTYVAPATTTISKHDSSVIHPSPLFYNAPVTYSHFIKKRSPQYFASKPLATTYTLPYVQTADILPAANLPFTTVHFIKKRSAELLSPAFVAPTTYSTYSAATPLVSTYSAPLISSSSVVAKIPYISTPYGLTTHFIKKRSAPVLSTYVAPTSYSQFTPI